MTLPSLTTELTPTAPFDFDQSLKFLGLFPPTQAEQTVADHSLTKATCLAGQPLAFQVTTKGTIEQPALAVTLSAAQPISPATEQLALDQISFFLSLDDELASFYAVGREDAAFAPVLNQLYGYHQVKFLTPFENACWAIFTQRNPMPLAQRMKRALIEHFDLYLDLEQGRYWAFPEAAQVATLSGETLATLLQNNQKAGYLLSAAQAFAQVDPSFLRHGPYDDVKAWLQNIKGLGAWSAEFILIRGLGRMAQAAFSEKRLLAVINQRYANGQPLTQSQAQEIAQSYGPWQGYWAHYLRAAE